jgi:O-antigen ligase
MFKEISLLKNENTNIFFPILLICLLPVIILSGSAIINTSVILIGILFLINLFKFDHFNKINLNYLIYLSLFFFSLLINIFTSEFGLNDFSRQVGFFRYIIFVFAVAFFFNYKNKKYQHLIFKIWFLIFIIVSFDLIFEFIVGSNLFGNVSYLEGRLASFLGDELKIGNFYFGFFLIALCFLIKTKLNSKFFLISTIIFLFIAFIIGERSNFIKIFLSTIIFFSLIKGISGKFKFFTIFITFIFVLMTTFLNKDINSRMMQIYKPVLEKGVVDYVKSSHYGAHYDTALKIFNNYKYFGIGLKQFRYESAKEVYDENENNIYNRDNWATHPHQIHFEILSETGLFGYTSFIIFFILSLIKALKSYMENRNIYLLSSIIFIILSLIPILPSGSFFTTYSATIFWMNYSLLIAFDNYEYDKKKT